MNDPQELWAMMYGAVDMGISTACGLLPDTPENAAGRRILLAARQEADRLFYQWLMEGFDT